MGIEFTVLGNPHALKRHRMFRHRNQLIAVDPSKADKNVFEVISRQHAPQKPFDCPLRVDMQFFFSRPKNHYGTGKNSQVLKSTAPNFHISRPDIDNCQKFVLDALNGVFWADDSIVCESTIRKMYDCRPRTEIVITLLTSEAEKLF
jgi:Holliday junction resolvase RusA-like endonuclease